MRRTAGARGVTLIELLVVLMLLSLILTAAVKTWDVTLERGRWEQTRKKLDQVATAITGDPDYIVESRRADFGYVGDMGELPRSLTDLVTKPPASPPESSRWRGPYIRPAVNESPENFRFDAWGESLHYDFQDSMFVRSLGGGGLANPAKWMTRSLGYPKNSILYNEVQGYVQDARGANPGSGILDRLLVQLEYSKNGLPFRDSRNVGTNGSFAFSFVPQGTHTLRAIFYTYAPPPRHEDTAVRSVVVVPGVGARDLLIRMPVQWP